MTLKAPLQNHKTKAISHRNCAFPRELQLNSHLTLWTVKYFWWHPAHSMWCTVRPIFQTIWNVLWLLLQIVIYNAFTGQQAKHCRHLVPNERCTWLFLLRILHMLLVSVFAFRSVLNLENMYCVKEKKGKGKDLFIYLSTHFWYLILWINMEIAKQKNAS